MIFLKSQILSCYKNQNLWCKLWIVNVWFWRLIPCTWTRVCSLSFERRQGLAFVLWHGGNLYLFIVIFIIFYYYYYFIITLFLLMLPLAFLMLTFLPSGCPHIGDIMYRNWRKGSRFILFFHVVNKIQFILCLSLGC